jgi:sec-independent protein translocase protein TatB
VFFNISPLEIVALVVIGVVLFGPDKLPSTARNAARFLRQFREFTANARADLKRELGPEFDGLSLDDLNPKRFVRKNLIGDGEDPLNLRELTELRGEVNIADDFKLNLDDTGTRGTSVTSRARAPKIQPGERPPIDADAT